MHLRPAVSLIRLAALAAIAFAATRSEAKLETLERILPGVWFWQGDYETTAGLCSNQHHRTVEREDS